MTDKPEDQQGPQQEIIPPGADSIEQPDSSPGSELQLYASFYKGVLPHPAHAERFEALLPGTFNRLLTMVERDQDASIKADSDQRQIDHASLKVGIGAALLIVGGTLWVFWSVAMAGHDTKPLAAVMVALEALVGYMFYRRVSTAGRDQDPDQ